LSPEIPFSLGAEAFLCCRTQHGQDRHARCCSPCRGRRAHHAQKERVGNWEVPHLTGLSLHAARSASGRRGAEADDARRRDVGPRHSSWEAGEQSGAIRGGAGGAKGGDRGECEPAKHVPDAEPGKRDPGAGAHTANCEGKASGSPLSTRGGSRMRESRTYGSVRGARGDSRPYRDRPRRRRRGTAPVPSCPRQRGSSPRVGTAGQTECITRPSGPPLPTLVLARSITLWIVP